MSAADTELLDLFREEVGEALDELGQVLETVPDGGEPLKQWLQRAFRLVHSVKGAARLMRMTAIETLAHAMEDGLSRCRDFNRAPAPDFANQLDRGITLILQLVDGKPVENEAAALASQITEREKRAAARRPKRGRGAAGDSRRKAEPPPAGTPAEESTAETDGVPGAPGDVVDPELAPADRGLRSTIRVNTRRLDALMGFSGEFLSLRARHRLRSEQLDQFCSRFERARSKLGEEACHALDELRRDLDVIAQRERQDAKDLGYLTTSFSDAINELRMQPLSGAVAQWRRVVRDAAAERGRDVRLLADVGDIEIDRQILDSLRDPLMHLLRNAVDHGIESPEARVAAGKPPSGTVAVAAQAVGNMVELSVRDDGRGLDPSKIAERAVERSFISADEVPSLEEAQVLEMLFEPGFSTATDVSRLSGRGVGLDVVRRRVADLDGHAAIAQRPEGGTVCTVRVPVSLVSTLALLVTASRGTYALPVTHVERVIRPAALTVETADGSALLPQSGGSPLRLRWLATLMQLPRPPDPPELTVVVVTNGSARLGLVVESVVDEAEFVTQQLPWNLTTVPCVGGAFVASDGVVTPVVDVPQIFDASTRSAGATEETVRVAEARAKPRILVVDDSLTSRTLERNILTAAGYEVEVEVNGALAWARLQADPPHLVVSDVDMPEVSGLELTRRIRADARLRDLPVVLVTSLGRPEDLAEGAAVGADEYIVKGRFEQRQLLEAVARLL